MCPREPRIETWRRLARDLPLDRLRGMVETHALEDLPELGRRILAGEVRGRAAIALD